MTNYEPSKEEIELLRNQLTDEALSRKLKHDVALKKASKNYYARTYNRTEEELAQMTAEEVQAYHEKRAKRVAARKKYHAERYKKNQEAMKQKAKDYRLRVKQEKEKLKQSQTLVLGEPIPA